MEAYRDQYATIFNDGKGVKVLAISADDVQTQQAWAAEKSFPVTFLSDTEAVAGKLYDTKYPLLSVMRRVVFVIGPDGRVTHIMRPFRELSADAYTELGEAVKKASGS
jgi:peroxiredoxin Q/BCP